MLDGIKTIEETVTRKRIFCYANHTMQCGKAFYARADQIFIPFCNFSLKETLKMTNLKNLDSFVVFFFTESAPRVDSKDLDSFLHSSKEILNCNCF